VIDSVWSVGASLCTTDPLDTVTWPGAKQFTANVCDGPLLPTSKQLLLPCSQS